MTLDDKWRSFHGAICRLARQETYGACTHLLVGAGGDIAFNGRVVVHQARRPLTFGNVGSMTICAVLRCQAPGSTVIAGGQHLNDVHEACICAEHYEKINAGELWDARDGHVLMGQDLPPVLRGWTLTDSRGSRGFVLSLKTSDPDAKPFDVFITPEHAKHLHTITESRRGE